ncbi:hypothetical protein LDENG_00195650 [Lucifuga dentata]|nr:hypothetical protein LDENG_00195650 [Lucifuga dentata]
MGCFSEAGTARLVTIERRMTAAKYREVLEENLLQSAVTSDRGDGSPFSMSTT